MIDSHCHLADAKFGSDLEDVLRCARDAGIEKIVSIADTLDEAERCIQISEEHAGVFATVGVHPHHAKDWSDACGERLKELVCSSATVRAVGEIGLDYHYTFSPPETQRTVFREQLRLAKALSLPVVVHCRDAVNDLRSIVEEEQPESLVLHCCTETWNDARWFVERGYMLSFTGIATYPSAEEVRRTIAACPIEKLMIETDAPYLSPMPHRGERNEPAFVREVCRVIARVKAIPEWDIDHMTTQNAVRFFGLPHS